MSLFGWNWFQRKKAPIPLAALLVDDSKWVRIPVAVLLRREFGMCVLEAENGLEGIEMAKAEQPAVILLDVMMPQLDGFDTLQKLKESPLTRSIPVLMCTARDNTREVNMALHLGAVGYLTKPIVEDQLISQVGKVLKIEEKKRKPGGSILNYDEQLTRSRTEALVPSDPPPLYTHPQPQSPAMKSPRLCSRCQKNLTMVEQYQAWYCYDCQMYPDYEGRP